MGIGNLCSYVLGLKSSLVMFSLSIVALFFGEQELNTLSRDCLLKENFFSLYLAKARQVTKSNY